MAASKTLNAEQRSERARNAHIAASVSTVGRLVGLTPEQLAEAQAIAARAPEPSPDVKAKLRAIFGSVTR